MFMLGPLIRRKRHFWVGIKMQYVSLCTVGPEGLQFCTTDYRGQGLTEVKIILV